MNSFINNLSRKVLIPLSIFFLSLITIIVCGVVATRDARSQVAVPVGDARPRDALLTPYPFPCDQVAPDDSYFRDDEFHSLRPYQASPCNQEKEDLALFCGNDLYVGDAVTITRVNNGPEQNQIQYISEWPINRTPWNNPDYTTPCTYCAELGDSGRLGCFDSGLQPPECIPWDTCTPGSVDECRWCQLNSDGTETCTFNISGTKDIAVDLMDAEFPIMGYTEPSVGNDSEPYKVSNSNYEEEETIAHSTKMNEYVSWYLNGVIGRAEYHYPDPTTNCVGQSSGKPGWCETKIPATNFCMTYSGLPIVTKFPNFDHIADGKGVCTGEDYFCCVSLLNSNASETDVPDRELIKEYSGPVKKLVPFSVQNTVRTDEALAGATSRNQDAGVRHDQYVGCHYGGTFSVNLFGNWVDMTFSNGVPVKCYGNGLADTFKDELRLSLISRNSPPLEENYEGRPFIEWQKDYREWRGDICMIRTFNLPFLGEMQMLLCLNNPLSPDIYSNLFAYTPLSSTEDRLGDVRIKDIGVIPQSNLTLLYYAIRNLKNADLFFPHMEEGVDLSDLLRGTYAFKDSDPDELGRAISVPDNPYCDYAVVRGNPGDDLFAGELSASIDYTVALTCNFFVWGDGQNADYGNLCRNLAGADCVKTSPEPSRFTRCDVNYGQYDCQYSFDYCATGCEKLDYLADRNCAQAVEMYYGNSGGCVPNDYQGASCYDFDQDVGFQLCPDGWKCAIDTAGCVSPPPQEPNRNQACFSSLLVGVHLETRTPLADKVWSRLVAGTSGVFRRMFPRVEEGAPVEGIADIPTHSPVTYQNLSGGLLFAGNPGSGRGGEFAEIYFPHIGGVKEYFLSAIQTAIRPKGYGKPIYSEIPGIGNLGQFDCQSLGEYFSSDNVNTSGSCGICNSNLGPLAQAILTKAGQTYGVPAAAIYATMLFEGAGWPEYQGQFTDENVCSWSAPLTRDQPGNMPRCDNTNSITQPPFGWIENWFYAGEGRDAPWTAVQAFDSTKDTRDKVNRCNFIDAVYATAKALHIGTGYIPPAARGLTSCHGYPEIPQGRSVTCASWDNQMMFLARQAYAGYCPEPGKSGPYPANASIIPGSIEYFNEFKCF